MTNRSEPLVDAPIEILDDELDVGDRQLTTRVPFAPSMTLTTLAARKGEAIAVFEALLEVLDVARKRSIAMTFPEDWVGFRAPDGRVTCYLSDAGCDRVRDVLGVEVFGISTPERIVSGDGRSFMYLIRGSGRSRITQQVVESIEGGRSSTDDICKGVTGAALELLVRKMARANLDGNITRELMGLKSVPLDELRAVWTGTSKSVDHIRKGRGFGTGDERHGGTREGQPDVPPPTCPVCPKVNGRPVVLAYRAAKGDRKPFYGCPNFEKHSDHKVIVDVDEWVAQSKATAKPATPPAAATSSPSNGQREPGAEG